MRYLLLILLLSACAHSRGYKVYLNLKGQEYISTSIALLELQMQSKNERIQYGSSENHDSIISYKTNDEVAQQFTGGILGIAWVGTEPCEIDIVERTYNYGQDLVNSVVWHEIGHCLGFEHSSDPSDIMYPYANPLSSYSEKSKQRFFRRIYEETH